MEGSCALTSRALSTLERSWLHRTPLHNAWGKHEVFTSCAYHVLWGTELKQLVSWVVFYYKTKQGLWRNSSCYGGYMFRAG